MRVLRKCSVMRGGAADVLTPETLDGWPEEAGQLGAECAKLPPHVPAGDAQLGKLLPTQPPSQ